MGGNVFSTESKNEMIGSDSSVRNRTIISLNTIDNVAKGLCEVYASKSVGYGFFGIICRNSTTVYGLFTNNHVVNNDYLRNNNQVKCLIKNEVILITVDQYYFTCEFLDVTFIKISSIQKNEVEQKGGEFLTITASKSSVCSKDTLTIFHYLHGENLTLTTDIVDELWGSVFYPKVSTELCLSGSPVVGSSGTVIGIYKGYCNRRKRNVAVHMYYIQDVILRGFEKNNFSFSSSLVLSKLNESHIEELEQIGLVYLQSSLFVSPASYGTTPIWFLRTFHSWFWSPTDPRKISNWMKISLNDDIKVIGGNWDKQEPALKNIRIIQFLKKNGEKYLIDA